MTTAIAEIFSQGDEVVTGQIADTNAAWLARQVTRLGFDVLHHSAVSDRLEPMVEQLRAIERRADLCLCTGGLGPTVDDLTTAAVAAAFDRPLVLDEVALQQIEDFFQSRRLPMPTVNSKQAWLPSGAERIDNHWGTAPGFLVQQGRCLFVFFPGVPSEMRAMFAPGIENLLVDKYRLTPPRLAVLRIFGLGESLLQQCLAPLELPAGVRLGFRAGVPQNEVKLLFPAGYPPDESDRLVARAAALIGDPVFSVGDSEDGSGSLAATVGGLLERAGARLATAESYSGGQLAWQCRGQPWLLQSLVAPEPSRLSGFLGMTEGTDPADLPAVAGTLAEALRLRCGADYALVVLGTLPPGDPDDVPPPGTAVLALSGAFGRTVSSRSLAGTSERRQIQAAAAALDYLRRHLVRESNGV